MPNLSFYTADLEQAIQEAAGEGSPKALTRRCCTFVSFSLVALLLPKDNKYK